MSRKKKSRKLSDKITVKTGSKKNFIEPGQKGRIPSKNKLAKHRNRPKSAYQKYLEENGLTEEQHSGQTQSEPQRETSPAQAPSGAMASDRVDTAQDAPPEAPAADFDELDGDELWDRFDSGSDR